MVNLISALIVQLILDTLHGFLNALCRLSHADVINLRIGLCQKRIVDGQLRVESYRSHWWQKQTVALVVFSRYIVSDKAPQLRNYDAIIFKQ